MGGHGLTEIAIVVVFALIGGLALTRIKQPPILGYILAGVILGPSCFSLVSDRESVTALAELGVLMLLFSIGMELSLRSFRVIWPLAVSTVALQLGASIGIFYGCHSLFGWDLASSLFFACVFALSSTAVAVKMLESIGELRSTSGKVIVAILIGQDLALIPMILLMRSVHDSFTSASFWMKIIVSIGLLGFIIHYLGRRRRIHLPLSKFLTAGDGELLPLASLTLCFACAGLSGLLGLSAAYGAFLAGLILGNTSERKEMIKATHPIQSILIMVFFLSVGLLLDLGYVWDHFFKIFGLLALATVGKTLLNVFILHLLKQPWHRAFLASLVLSQIGEFSFVLVSVGLDSHLIDADGQKLVIAVTVLSLFLSPFWVESARRLHNLNPESISGMNQLMRMLYSREWQSFKRLSDRIFAKAKAWRKG